MIGQMTIWDLMPQESLENIPENEMAERIGNAIGVKFVKNDFYGDYRCKVGKFTLSVEYDHYFPEYGSEEPGALFIGCGCNFNLGGTGAPCDSIAESIEWFEREKKYYHIGGKP